jgi:hypothetical protein
MELGGGPGKPVKEIATFRGEADLDERSAGRKGGGGRKGVREGMV